MAENWIWSGCSFLLSLCLAAVLQAGGPTEGTPFRADVAADACLRAGQQADECDGLSETLLIRRAFIGHDGHSVGVLKFPMPGPLAANQSLILNLYVDRIDEPVDIMIWHAPRTDWHEETVTYANDPHMAEPHVTSMEVMNKEIPAPIITVPVNTAGQWLQIDISPAVRRTMPARTKELGLYVMSGELGVLTPRPEETVRHRIWIAAKESGNGAFLSIRSGKKTKPAPNPHPIVLITDGERPEMEARIAEWSHARLALDYLRDQVDPVLARWEEDPAMVLSLMQLWWRDHHSITVEEGWNQGITGWEGRSLLPTLKWSPGGLPGNEAPWKMVAARLDEAKPYEDGETIHARYNGVLGDYDVRQSGAAIESANAQLTELMLSAAFLYWFTGDERYAGLSADILWQICLAVYFTNTPDRQYAGITSTETIHDRAMSHVPLAYDFLYDYLVENDIPTAIMEYTMRRSALNWLSRGYGGNWTLWETSHMAPMALVLSSDTAYADGLGKESVLRHILQEDVFSPRYDLLTHQSLERAIEQYDPATGLKSESPGYSQASSGFPLRYLALLRNGHEVDLFSDPKLAIFRDLPFNYFEWGDTLGRAQAFSDLPKRLPFSASDMELLAMMADTAGDENYLARLAALYAFLHPERLSGNQTTEANRYSVQDLCLSNNLLAFWPSNKAVPLPRRARSFYAPVQNNVVGRGSIGAGPNAGMITVYGEGTGGHDQLNGLSMECHFLGRPLLSDWGGSGYQKTAARWHLGTLPAHNTVVIRGFDLPARAAGGLDVHWVEPALSSRQGTRSDWGLNPDFNLIDAGIRFDMTGRPEMKEQATEYHLEGTQRRLVGMIRISDDAVWFVDIMHSDETGNADLFHDYITNPLGVFQEATDGEGNPLGVTSIGDNEGFGQTPNEHVSYREYKQRKQVQIDGSFWARYRGAEDFYVHAYLADNGSQRDVFMVKGFKSALYGVDSIRGADSGKTDRQVCIVRQKGEAWEHPFMAAYEATLSEKRTMGSISSDADQGAWQAMTIDGAGSAEGYRVHVLHTRPPVETASHEGGAQTVTSQYAGITFDAAYAVVSEHKGALENIYLGEGRKLMVEGYGLESLDGPVSANLKVLEDGAEISVSTPTRLRVGLPLPRKEKSATGTTMAGFLNGQQIALHYCADEQMVYGELQGPLQKGHLALRQGTD